MEREIDRKELLVWGFIRNIEKQHKHLNIPIEINSIIYLFQRLCDEWCHKYKSNDIVIDTDKSIITMKSDGMITVYGAEVITSGVFIWRLRIVSLYREAGNYHPFVGIVKDDEEYLQTYLDYVDFDDFGYQLVAGDDTASLFSCLSGNAHCDHGEKCVWNQNGDILALKLDLDEQTLSIKVNDADFIEMFTNIEVPANGYRLALSVCKCKGSQFQIL